MEDLFEVNELFKLIRGRKDYQDMMDSIVFSGALSDKYIHKNCSRLNNLPDTGDDVIAFIRDSRHLPRNTENLY